MYRNDVETIGLRSLIAAALILILVPIYSAAAEMGNETETADHAWCLGVGAIKPGCHGRMEAYPGG